MGDAGLRSKKKLQTDDLKTIHNAGSIEKEVRNQAKILIRKLGINSHNIEAAAAAWGSRENYNLSELSHCCTQQHMNNETTADNELRELKVAEYLKQLQVLNHFDVRISMAI